MSAFRKVCYPTFGIVALSLIILFVFAPLSAAGINTSLDEGFQHPPRSAGIRCFWWWLNSNVTKEAITRDLEEMKAKGFSGALVFDAGGAEQRGNRQVPAGPTFASAAWRDLFRHAVNEAQRLGLELSLNIQSGWNLGGPFVTPEMAAKTLSWSETRVQGSTLYQEKLPLPRNREGFYRDIAVLAYPMKDFSAAGIEITARSAQQDYPAAKAIDGDDRTFWVSGSNEPGMGPTASRPEWLELRSVQVVTVSGLEILGRKGYGPRQCQLRVSENGTKYTPVLTFELQDGKTYTNRFKPVKGKLFRLIITRAYDVNSPAAPRNVQVAEFHLLDENQKRILTHQQNRRPIKDLQAKAVFTELGMSAPDCRFLLTDYPATPGEEDTTLKNIINLTDKLDSDGLLRWEVPQGQWIILRFGYTLNGVRVSTSSADWQGRVLDYLDSDAFRFYWHQIVEPILSEIGPSAGKTLKYLATDSWECGGANWTMNFAQEFKKRRGYDPIPYLPIIAGKIVENRDVSNSFLADFRKTISDCIAENHYQVFAELAHQHNLGIQPESGGPHAGPFDAMKCLGRNDITMGEFWVPSGHRPAPVNRFYVKQSACVAHIYGRKLVGAEAFTSIGPHWNDPPWRAQKPSFDHEACSGLNLVFVHTFTCSPKEMGIPGQEYFAGTHFNPNITWWDYTDAFITYLNRCQYLFQQGRFVADVLYYYGDHVPNVLRYKEDDPAQVLPGYDYDVTNEEILISQVRVKEGRLILDSGMSYRALVLPDHKVLSLAVLRKVVDLVQDGAIVIGPKPERTVSLVEYPESETEFRMLTDALWGEKIDPVGQNEYGRGKVFWGKPARQVLLENDIVPDLEISTADTPDPKTDYIHYTIDKADVYFVSNQSDKAIKIDGKFRIKAKLPEIWDPVTGKIRPALAFRQHQGRTSLPLQFAPYGSLLVVFRRTIPAEQQGKASSNFPDYEPVLTIEDPWQVSFDPQWGGPASVRFDKLVSWTAHPDPAIKYYSGKATYMNTFSLSGIPSNQRYMLDLGELGDIGIAKAYLNGRDIGVVWARPFRVEVTDALSEGENQLKIEVVNSWRNRLVGDRDLPADKRFTRTNISIRRDWQLLESGLLGPVRLLKEK